MTTLSLTPPNSIASPERVYLDLVTNGPTADASLVAGVIDGGRQLDQPAGTVKSRIRSGMRRLSTALAEVALRAITRCLIWCPATFTWTGEVTGFAPTREVAGGVVSSEGDVVSVIADL